MWLGYIISRDCMVYWYIASARGFILAEVYGRRGHLGLTVKHLFKVYEQGTQASFDRFTRCSGGYPGFLETTR